MNRYWVGLVVAAIAVTGCVEATATPSESPPTATVTVLPSSSPIVFAATPSIAGSSAPDTPTPEPTDPLTSVAAAPGGTWTSVKWTALPPVDGVGLDPQREGSSFQVFGWSGGFVGFVLAPAPPDPAAESTDPLAYPEPDPPIVIASYSSDGLQWHLGQKLDPKAAGSVDLQLFRRVIEGPAGLLAVGWSGGCASEYLDSLWTSKDGMSWQPVNPVKAFGLPFGSIVDVSGGAAGFVATAYYGKGTWTSRDGRSWKRVNTGAAVFKGARVDDGTAGADGFVLAGVTGARTCATLAADATPTPLPPVTTPTVWTSPDGSTWKRANLPGAQPSREYQWVRAVHLSDHGLLVIDDGGAGGAWGSKDGRAWTPVTVPADLVLAQIVSGGQHNLVVGGSSDAGAPGPLDLRTFDEGFALVPVAQSGAVPSTVVAGAGNYAGYGLVALGPTGVVVTSIDGTQLWFGVPAVR